MSPAPTEESNRHYEGWRVALASAGGVFFSFASLLVYTFGIFLKPLSETFHWSRESVSLAFGLAAISVAMCSPLIGAILDRTAPRKILLPCFAVFGTAFTSLSLLTPHRFHLYATFVVMGLVGNGTAHLAYAGALSSWFDEKRGTALAVLMSGGALGAMFLPLIAQALIARFGWRVSFALLGCSVLALGLPIASRVRLKPGARAHADSLAGATVAESLRTRAYWLILAVLFAASLSQNGSLTHLSAILTDRGVTASSSALAVAVLGGATLAGRLLTGWLLDRFFAPRVAFCLMATAALGVYVISVAASPLAGYLGAALIGFGMGGEADTTPYLLTRYFGLRSFSALYGISWTAYAVAGAVGPVIMGRAFDLTGSYSVLLARLSVFTLAAAALLLLLPRYRQTVEPVAVPTTSAA